MNCFHYSIQEVYNNEGIKLSERHKNWGYLRLGKRQVLSTCKYVWKYENRREIEMLQYQPPNRLYRKDLSFYDKSGKLSYTKSFVEGILFCENQFQYDQKDRKTLMIDINHEFDMRTVYQYTYDNKDLLRETREYDEKGKFLSSNVYTYNKKGQKIKEELIFGNDLVGHKTFEYDKQGNLICTKRYRKVLEGMETREYKYYKHGHKIFVTSVRYECDCTGVREIPDGYTVYNYKY